MAVGNPVLAFFGQFNFFEELLALFSGGFVFKKTLLLLRRLLCSDVFLTVEMMKVA